MLTTYFPLVAVNQYCCYKSGTVNMGDCSGIRVVFTPSWYLINHPG